MIGEGKEKLGGKRGGKEAGRRAYLLIEFSASMIPVAMVSHLMIPPNIQIHINLALHH